VSKIVSILHSIDSLRQTPLAENALLAKRMNGVCSSASDLDEIQGSGSNLLSTERAECWDIIRLCISFSSDCYLLLSTAG